MHASERFLTGGEELAGTADPAGGGGQSGSGAARAREGRSWRAAAVSGPRFCSSMSEVYAMVDWLA
ncbi:hypothetical protein U9M48_005321 [Paspalum notatum var. saurae]|uniref:Uncharacterized protein n=1 Tax=Paspalum notatum var. saurae TaxID=547442 RepID=A0AAQ3PLM0_PASNO